MRAEMQSQGQEKPQGGCQKMIRRIIRIDQEKCNGCGACAAACHEGAIGMVDGKAKLAAGRLLRRAGRLPARLPHRGHHLCGARGRRLRRSGRPGRTRRAQSRRARPCPAAVPAAGCGRCTARPRRTPPPRRQRPVAAGASGRCQIKLVPVNAPYFDGCEAAHRRRLHRLRLRRLPRATSCGARSR